MMNYPKKPGGLRAMRRIPVALTCEESAALHWLKHFATESQLPKEFWPFRKLALHLTIKSLSAENFTTLVNAHRAAAAANN
jgi:hypothetical protein